MMDGWMDRDTVLVVGTVIILYISFASNSCMAGLTYTQAFLDRDLDGGVTDTGHR